MQQNRWSWLVVLSLAVLVLFTGSQLQAQATNTGTVVGTVTDPTGAVIPQANVTMTDATTNLTLTTKSNATGQYVITAVPPGKYDITIGREGFELAKVHNQTVSVGTQTTVNVKMRVGSQSQTVEVSVTGTELQTLNSTVGSTVPEEAIEQLPSLLHDAGTFTELQPGVSPDGSVAGAVVDQSTFMLDGGNNTNDMDGSMSVYTGSFAGDPTGGSGGQSSYGDLAPGPTGVMPTPSDSVEEFKVNTANQTADFNNSAGAQVEVVTRRGKDQIHGTAYEYYLDNNFNANSWSNDLSATPIPSYHYSKFGASAGGPLTPKAWGNRTYIFGLYQGWRFPQATTFAKAVPSPSLLAGIITDPSTGNTYNMKAIDPRGIGINPTVLAMWQKYEPAGTASSCPDLLGKYCDTVNTVEFKANMQIPEKDNFLVGRIDHSFGDKWQWMASYRFYKLTKTSTSQVDTGGFFPGDKLGTPVAVGNRPQQPWFFVTGLTTQITQKLTNDFHYSFLRNYWSWSDDGAPPQETGLGAALEPMGESAGTNALSPFNVNTQSIRTRFWDGHDTFISDDLSYMRGKHLLQFGGQYQRNWDYHQRTDNGGGINNTPVYQLGDSSGAGLIDLSGLTGGFPSSSTSVARVAAAAYGMVSDSQVAYTRSGNNLALNAPLSPAFDQSTIDYENVYFGDSWKIRPSFTLNYGLGWTLELPPTEATGKQDVLVDASDTPIDTVSYLHQREAAAQQGSVYNPELGFALVGNVGSGQKYPYDPFYGSFSPRVAAAWNPHFDGSSILGKIFGNEGTVIRGGYGRQYGRLNGVDQVLVPLLGVGLIQAVQCRQVLNTSSSCGSTNPTASTAFRIGVDGNTAPLPVAAPTLPQPAFTGYNLIAGSAAEALDPHFRPNVIDSFDLTVQRQVSRSTLVELGYIGRIIKHEYQPINLNAVPYMTVSGSQNFAKAYAGLETAIGCATSAGGCGAGVPASKTSGGTPNAAYATFINNTATSNKQSFFESAMLPGYCKGSFSNGDSTPYANCTAAVLDNELGNLEAQAVWSMWSDLDAGNMKFPRTMMNTAIPGQALGGSGQASSGIAENASIGYGNYNAGFLSVKTSNYHGLMFQENLTYSKALGTGAVVQASSEYTANDPFDLKKMYGVQAFNRKYVFNTYAVWKAPWYSNQAGVVGRLVGGWSLAPIFTAGSGEPEFCNTQTDAQSFGSGDGNDYFDNENCVFTSKSGTGGASSHYGVAGGTDPNGISVGTSVASSASGTPVPINMFKDPVSVWNHVRPAILGIDEKDSGLGPITGMPYWNLDMSLTKNFRIAERASFEFTFITTNVLNHTVMADPLLALYAPSAWGTITGNVNTPRQMEFGLRLQY